MHNKFLPIIAAGVLVLAGCSSTKSSSDTSAPQPDTTTLVAPTGSDTTTAAPAPDNTDPVVTDGAEVDSTIAGATATTAAPMQAVTNISIQPGLSKDKFVGAATDVKTERCSADATGWSASGTVTNTSGSNATYRIYVAFNAKGSTDTRGLVQADVAVSNGKTEKWKATAKLADKDLICILRVERTTAP